MEYCIEGGVNSPMSTYFLFLNQFELRLLSFSNMLYQFMAHTEDYGTSAIQTNDIAVWWNIELLLVV